MIHPVSAGSYGRGTSGRTGFRPGRWMAAGSVFDGYRHPLGFVRMGKGAACHSGSSGIGSDKAGLLHNKAHGEAEEKGCYGSAGGTKERQRSNVRVSLFFG